MSLGCLFKKRFDDRYHEVASLINELKDDGGKAIPIIFCPWHE